MSDPLSRLRELAEKATPGERIVRHATSNGWMIDVVGGGCIAIEAWHGGPECDRHAERFKADGDFIAACSPSVILALLDQQAKLHTAAALFASVIKSGEAWTPECQAAYDAAFPTPGDAP